MNFFLYHPRNFSAQVQLPAQKEENETRSIRGGIQRCSHRAAGPLSSQQEDVVQVSGLRSDVVRLKLRKKGFDLDLNGHHAAMKMKRVHL